MYYRRYLPHWQPENADFFVRWRLAGSIPKPVPGIANAFERYDAALDRATGPCWLSDPRVAAAVRDTLLYGATERQLYDLDAWVVMPNHVHVLFAPKKPLAPIMHWLKRSTATRANRILGRSGAFWQAESYDHWIRTDQEWKSIVGYIEKNPVTAGLAASDDEWPWSSAWRSADNKIICATE
jgi:REP element-mobilizing transposase RayT